MSSHVAQRNGSTRKWRETRKRMLRSLPMPCGICGGLIVDPAQCDVDHVLPVQFGGTDHPSNLRLTHASCNRGRRVTTGPAQPPIPAPTDANPGTLGRTWSRHWGGPFDLRCPECRKRGGPCPDATDAPDLAA